jgi:D-amino-acid dehydrogenase
MNQFDTHPSSPIPHPSTLNPQPSTLNQTAIVIGGGIIGCSTAYYLSKLGWRVRLVEAGRVGRGCSHGNCGFICPSHVLPLTMPGAVWPVMRRMFNRDSAIYLKPRWDPALWVWLARFALRCRRGTMLRAAAARHALLSSSMALYRQIIADESLDLEWQDQGLLLVFKLEREFEAYEKIAGFVRDEFGIIATRCDAAQLADLEPALKPGNAGAWHYPGDAHLRPDRLMDALSSVLRARGVEILEETTVTRFNIEAGRARSVETSAGSIEAQTFVLATGAQAPSFAAQLGSRIPIQPGKGYSITMPRPAIAPRIPIIFEEHHVAVTPWASGIRIGSTMEFTGYDSKINPRRIELFKRVAAECLIEPPAGPIQEEWYGWRPMTYDDLPCIGRTSKAQNVIVAAGHGMIGMATGPASGKLAAELASGAEPHVDPAPYLLQRFGG